MIGWPFGRDRRWMLRSYLVLAGGLMVAALVLNVIFSRLQDSRPEPPDPWVSAAFRLAEAELLAATPNDRPAVLQRLQARIGMPVQLLAAADTNAPASEQPMALVADDGHSYYLQQSPALQAALRIGPVTQQPDTTNSARFLPALFYLSILVIVGLWLRPLLADVRVLTNAAQRFAADYREPASTVRETTQLTSLARNLDDMSSRLSHLIQSQKELTAALSHEMRTPLARIRFALAVIGNGADDTVQRQLRDINADVAQIDGLIASLLDYARLDHPDLRMDWQQIELDPWFRHVLAAASLPGRQVELHGLDRLTTAWMEPQLMELAISNLIANAYRFARDRVRVRIAMLDDHYQIAVEDDGDGIPEEKRAEIFKAYKRLDSSRNRATGGFGLGLAIVARVAALHGGSATADASKALGGARLSVSWPRAPR